MLLGVLFVSCKKNNGIDPSSTGSDTTPESIFMVHGVADVIFDNWMVAAMGITIEHDSGEQKTTTISLGEMPPGVTYEIRPASGVPTFGSSILFTTTGVSVGTHPATLTVSNGSVTKDYNFNLHLGDSKCNDGFTGYYDQLYEYCFGPTIRFVSVQQDHEISNRVLLSFKNSWDSNEILLSFYIELNCNTNEITVPQQHTQLGDISGSGYFDAGKDNDMYVIYLSSLKLVDAAGDVQDCPLVFYLIK